MVFSNTMKYRTYMYIFKKNIYITKMLHKFKCIVNTGNKLQMYFKK